MDDSAILIQHKKNILIVEVMKVINRKNEYITFNPPFKFEVFYSNERDV